MKYHAIACLAVLLAGCQNLPHYAPSTSSLGLRPGSLLLLHTAVEVPGGGASVYVQGGRTMKLWDVVEFDPHCIFELHTRSDSPRQVLPDTFTVSDLRWGFGPIGALKRPLLVAQLWGNDSPPTQFFYKTEYRLQSAKQPDVYRLICQADRHLASGMDYHTYLSRAEVDAALGQLFSLTPPDGGPGY